MSRVTTRRNLEVSVTAFDAAGRYQSYNETLRTPVGVVAHSAEWVFPGRPVVPERVG